MKILNVVPKFVYIIYYIHKRSNKCPLYVLVTCRFLKQKNKHVKYVGILKNANILENHTKVKCATVACQ